MIHPLNCREVSRRMALGDISQYDWQDRIMMRFHLLICWVCRRYERQMSAIGKAFSHLAGREIQANWTPQFKARLTEHLKNI